MTQRKGDPFDPDMQIDLIWFNSGVFVCDTICGKVNYHNYTHKKLSIINKTFNF